MTIPRTHESGGGPRPLLDQHAMRFVLALILVVTTVIVVVVGVVKEMDPQDLHQYLAPITGLTGAAVGYWFGARQD